MFETLPNNKAWQIRVGGLRIVDKAGGNLSVHNSNFGRDFGYRTRESGT